MPLVWSQQPSNVVLIAKITFRTLLSFVDPDQKGIGHSRHEPRAEGMITYQETFVQRNQHRIYVRDHAGTEPAVILMHGFPDNVHLYDRLSPYLSPPRRVVLFDFLGWGSSDKPSGYAYTAEIKSARGA